MSVSELLRPFGVATHRPFDFPWSIQTDFMPGWAVCLIFVACAVPIVALGMHSLAGLGPIRQWVAIGLRLGVLLLSLLVWAGVRWQRAHSDLEVIVLRDISESTTQVKQFPNPHKSLQPALDSYFGDLSQDPTKRPADLIGVMSFHQNAMIDALPNTRLVLGARGVRDAGTGTDPASAIQLALASMSKDAMHRLLLVWDGNQTVGDLDAVLSSAAAQRVQIDVMPLTYDVKNEVLIDRFIAPTWKRENEPFSLEVVLRSTNASDVTGKLSVLHQGTPMDLDPVEAGVQGSRKVTLKQGLNRQTIRVPGSVSGGVHQFRAMWESDAATAQLAIRTDTLAVNNFADAFTFVRGRGEILYVDGVKDGGGELLPQALTSEGIHLVPVSVDQFPQNLVQLLRYDAVVLANVSRAALGEQRQEMLARYVHDTGGGLLMIGGEETFGAGGWQNSELEKVLPVDMDVPAQRQVPQGALVIVMDRSGSMNEPFGGTTKQFAVNQSAILALRALSEQDLVGVVSFDAAAQWVYPLQINRHADHLANQLKNVGNGGGTYIFSGLNEAIPALERCDASAKHIILLTDGQTQPADYTPLIERMRAKKIHLTTVGVGDQADEALLTMLATEGGGRFYRVNSPQHLTQIFIKEVMLVRRTLIQESDKGLPLTLGDPSDELVKGLGSPEPLFGLVLTTKKNDPKVSMPIVAATGKEGIVDPVLAHWQAGLGRSAVFTGDAHNKWGSRWVASSGFSKFWAQVVRGVARPPMSADFDVQTTIAGDKGKLVIEASDQSQGFLNFVRVNGMVMGPDLRPVPLRAVQVAPGRYEAAFDANTPGNYVISASYVDKDGKTGQLRSGAVLNASPELRDLKSNEAKLYEVANRTGGRVLTPFDARSAELFRREGLHRTASSLPAWDLVIPFLLGLFIVDVAARRIAWDWESVKRMGLSVVAFTRSHTTTPRVDSRGALDALAGVRQRTAEETGSGSTPSRPVRPDPKARFEAKQQDAKVAEGEITQVLGGATNKPVAGPSEAQAQDGAIQVGEHMDSLIAAKKRAQQRNRRIDEGT